MLTDAYHYTNVLCIWNDVKFMVNLDHILIHYSVLDLIDAFINISYYHKLDCQNRFRNNNVYYVLFMVM